MHGPKEFGQRLNAIIDRMPARQSAGPRGAAPYLAAFVMVGLALGVRELMGPAELGLQFVTFFPAVALTAVYGGFLPGMAATALASTLATFLYIPPYGAFSFDFQVTTVWSNLVFFLDELVVCGAIQAMHNHYLSLRAANERLTENHHLLTELFEGSTDAIFLKDTEGRYLYSNAAHLSLSGKRLEDVVGRDTTNLFPADQARILKVKDGAIMAAGKIEHFEEEVSLSNGETRVFLTTKGPIHDAKGKIRGLFGIARDITAYKQAEAVLKRKQIVVDTAMDGYWMTDAEGNLLEVNQAYADISGYTTDELTRMHISQLEANERPEDVAAHIAKIMEIGHDRFETRHRHKDGRLIDIEVSARYLPEHRQIYVFSRDITARKEAAGVQLAAKAEAERANNAKSRFLAAASHDLRQPLSALSLYVGALRNKLGPGDQFLLSSMKDCVGSLNDMLSKLLDLSKLEAGVVAPKVSDFAVDDMFSAMVSTHAPEATQKGLALRCAYSGLIGRSDRVLFQRMLGNLVANAIRYTQRGGVLIGCRRRRGKTWIEVWDTGIGIPQEGIGEIFEEFKQLDNPGRNMVKGSGLGLTIVAKTAALLGLEVRVRSRPGKGSLFALEMPLGRRVEFVAENRMPPRPIRIALVEDNSPVAEALAYSLTNSGHQVVATSSRAQLLELVDGTPPDIVITDYRLGGDETGVDVIASLRERFGHDLPAIIVTGDTDQDLLRRLSRQDIRVHHKPLDLATLQNSIAMLTAGSPARKVESAP